jgi:DME family drug/metabolite transporter
MTRQRNVIIGVSFALGAAMCNGTVGVLSRSALSDGFGNADVAFWRCFGAFALLSIIVLARRGGMDRIAALAPDCWKIGICAFLGIFTLYHFETQAFALAPIPLVAVLVFAGGIGAILLDIFVLREVVTPRKVFAIALVFGGGYLLIIRDGLAVGSPLGIFLALIAGFGYASFMFAWKFFRLKSTMESLWWFFLFGSVFLAGPFFATGPNLPGADILPAVAALAVLPSFCGFLCTTFALKYIEAYRTQVIEASEPIFSALFGALVFSELLSPLGLVASFVIILGALITALPERRTVSA